MLSVFSANLCVGQDSTSQKMKHPLSRWQFGPVVQFSSSSLTHQSSPDYLPSVRDDHFAVREQVANNISVGLNAQCNLGTNLHDSRSYLVFGLHYSSLLTQRVDTALAHAWSIYDGSLLPTTTVSDFVSRMKILKLDIMYAFNIGSSHLSILCGSSPALVFDHKVEDSLQLRSEYSWFKESELRQLPVSATNTLSLYSGSLPKSSALDLGLIIGAEYKLSLRNISLYSGVYYRAGVNNLSYTERINSWSFCIRTVW